jgi:hypothetical protein
MTNRKLCGYDVNGWRDGVARNWVARPGDEEEIGVIRIVEGAVLPEVVRAGDGKTERWIGGAQADLAPHGRGGGWGKFGTPDRRRTVRSLIRQENATPDILAAAFKGLAQGASHSVVSIEDTEQTTEPMQERLFAALAGARAGKSLLVWRSVLSVLHALNAGTLEGAAFEGARIGIIGHVTGGFSVQTLRIRVEARGDDKHLAPERRQVGEFVASPLGYAGLVAAASAQIMALAPDSRSDHFQSARSIGQLTFGLKTKPEPLRRANGDWDILNPPDALSMPSSNLSYSWVTSMKGCEMVLFESLTEGTVRTALIRHLQDALPMPLTSLPATAVAKGALLAAERYAAGQTVYLDFLPRIATIVQGAEGALSYDLIGEAETLPAGSLYRSPRPARFALMAGQERFQVYLRKETHTKPRKAVVEVGASSQQASPVDLWVEQVPAAGRAKILMQAPTLSRQFTVDWDAAEVLDKTWDELLEDLGTPPPTIPKRLVLPCGMHAWEDSSNGPGLITLLEQNTRRARPNWAELATKLTARPFGQYCISSDGRVPAEVPREALGHLQDLTTRGLTSLQRMVTGSEVSDTAPLKFLTWQFRRCPSEVASILINAWEARARGRPHALATSASAWVLIRQGLGRVVSEKEQENRALTLLLRTPIQNWAWREETAAAAFLLSRSDECPPLLERADVELLGARVIKEFDESVGSEYTKFNYAPFLLVGLLRWRLKSSRALVAGSDHLADELTRSVGSVFNDISSRSKRMPSLQRVASRWLPILSATLDELRGSGKNPYLLAAIYDA